MESEVRKTLKEEGITMNIGSLSYFDATNNVVRLAKTDNPKNLYEYLGKATIENRYVFEKSKADPFSVSVYV